MKGLAMHNEYENDSFAATRVDQVQVIRFKQNLLHHLTELDDKEALVQCLEHAGGDDSVRVILILGCPEKPPTRETLNYISNLVSDRKNEHRLARVFNALDQLVLGIKANPKVIIHGDCGEILSPFFNLSLACDYRIVGDQARFRFASLELGLLPKGGGVYFLREKLGAGKTWDILLSGESISAPKALEMGLVDRVVPSGLLEDETMVFARELCKKPKGLLWGAKKLLNCPANSLPAYLKFENMVLLENIYSEGFKKRMDKKLE
ncbi:MAG: enoyl-CoA hydratase/isomerase family protein [Desulfatibacillum sp.]|nr:enoyl-CoA hydratase/isomerase family protein [Desulfatibacillum sp.]